MVLNSLWSFSSTGSPKKTCLFYDIVLMRGTTYPPSLIRMTSPPAGGRLPPPVGLLICPQTFNMYLAHLRVRMVAPRSCKRSRTLSKSLLTFLAGWRSESAGCRSALSMSKIKVKISETKYCSFYKTLMLCNNFLMR